MWSLCLKITHAWLVVDPICRTAIERFYDPADCMRLYYCISHVIANFKCPFNMVFSPPVNMCILRNRVKLKYLKYCDP